MYKLLRQDFADFPTSIGVNGEVILNLAKAGVERIETVPHNVNVLILDHNYIRRLENMTNLHDLQQLSVSNNKLLQMHGVAHLTNLTILNLPNNGIVTIDGLNKLAKLRWLNLSGNRIKVIEQLNYNYNLKHIDLSENCITKLGDVSFLKKLKTLLLHCNRIDNLENAAEYLPSCLEIFSLASNMISNISEISKLSGLKSLSQFSLGNNACAETDCFDYKLFVLGWLPQLRILDGVQITEVEISKAKEFMAERQKLPDLSGQSESIYLEKESNSNYRLYSGFPLNLTPTPPSSPKKELEKLSHVGNSEILTTDQQPITSSRLQNNSTKIENISTEISESSMPTPRVDNSIKDNSISLTTTNNSNVKNGQNFDDIPASSILWSIKSKHYLQTPDTSMHNNYLNDQQKSLKNSLELIKPTSELINKSNENHSKDQKELCSSKLDINPMLVSSSPSAASSSSSLSMSPPLSSSLSMTSPNQLMSDSIYLPIHHTNMNLSNKLLCQSISNQSQSLRLSTISLKEENLNDLNKSPNEQTKITPNSILSNTMTTTTTTITNNLNSSTSPSLSRLDNPILQASCNLIPLTEQSLDSTTISSSQFQTMNSSIGQFNSTMMIQSSSIHNHDQQSFKNEQEKLINEYKLDQNNQIIDQNRNDNNDEDDETLEEFLNESSEIHPDDGGNNVDNNGHHHHHDDNKNDPNYNNQLTENSSNLEQHLNKSIECKLQSDIMSVNEKKQQLLDLQNQFSECLFFKKLSKYYPNKSMDLKQFELNKSSLGINSQITHENLLNQSKFDPNTNLSTSIPTSLDQYKSNIQSNHCFPCETNRPLNDLMVSDQNPSHFEHNQQPHQTVSQQSDKRHSLNHSNPIVSHIKSGDTTTSEQSKLNNFLSSNENLNLSSNSKQHCLSCSNQTKILHDHIVLLRTQLQVQYKTIETESRMRQLHTNAIEFLLKEVEELKTWKQSVLQTMKSYENVRPTNSIHPIVTSFNNGAGDIPRKDSLTVQVLSGLDYDTKFSCTNPNHNMNIPNNQLMYDQSSNSFKLCTHETSSEVVKVYASDDDDEEEENDTEEQYDCDEYVGEIRKKLKKTKNKKYIRVHNFYNNNHNDNNNNNNGVECQQQKQYYHIAKFIQGSKCESAILNRKLSFQTNNSSFIGNNDNSTDSLDLNVQHSVDDLTELESVHQAVLQAMNLEASLSEDNNHEDNRLTLQESE